MSKTFMFLILVNFWSLTLLADPKLAIINDSDGYTNIRSGQGIEFPVVATINKDEFFYCELANSEWVKILTFKWQNAVQVEGYIHKSRIQLVENLSTKRQQEIFNTILLKQKALADNFQKAWRNKDSVGYRIAVRELEMHDETKYSRILDILPKYFCSTKDYNLLQNFYSTLIADKGSANEIPSFAVGKCFICDPDQVIEQLNKVTNSGERKLILDDIEWGLLNYYNVPENVKSNNKDFNKLKSQLDNERRR